MAAEIRSTAIAAIDYIYDGPGDATRWEQCNTSNCVAKFPVWMSGGQEPDNYTVKQFFKDHEPGSLLLGVADGLSQYNGSAIWLNLLGHPHQELFGDWNGGLKGWFSPFITNGKVNGYGLGTLMHEVLHKKSVGGGFTHDDMSKALGIYEKFGSCGSNNDKNSCSFSIGTKCFPNY